MLFSALLNYGMRDLIREGTLAITGPNGGCERFGQADAVPAATIRIHDHATVPLTRDYMFERERVMPLEA